jgi:RNA polymerase sigma-70 factor (ECF subfamily)
MTDAELVRRTRRGDGEAYGALVDRYRDAIYGLAYHYVQDFEEARDIAQESFIKGYVGLSELREPARFGPWLRRIAVNECLVWRRRQQDSWSLEELQEQGQEPSAEMDLDRLLLRLTVQKALECLSDASRLTVTLYYIDGYSQREIADFLEVPETTVKSRLRNARARLKKEMTEMVEDVLKEEPMPEEFAAEVLRQAVERAKELQAQGKIDEARAEAERAWEIDPAAPEVFRLLVETRSFRIGRPPTPETFQPRPAPPDVEIIGDLRDLSRRLRVSPVTVYRWLQAGMPCYGKDSLRFSLRESLAWLKERGLQPEPRAPGYLADEPLMGILHAACNGELTLPEAAEMVERFHTRELWSVIEIGGRLITLQEIAPLLPEPAASLVDEITRGYAALTRKHVELRQAYSYCENFEVPADRSRLWEMLGEIHVQLSALTEKFAQVMACRPADEATSSS